MIGPLIQRFYTLKNMRWRSLMLSLIQRIEGGEFYSHTLRAIFKHYHGIDVGMYSYGCFNLDNIPTGTRIGRYCSFARGVCLISGNHPMKFQSQHPFFYNPVFGYVDELKIVRARMVVENDVWFGQGAMLMPSVSRVSNGAVIGAGSVVTRDVPPYAVVAGNPARIIKYRFSRKTVDTLLSSRWWEKDIHEIKGSPEVFRSFTTPLS